MTESDIPVEMAFKAVDDLKSLRGSCAEHINKYSPQPQFDSIAHAELESFPISKLIEAAFSQGVLLVESVADHLDAFIRITEEPVQAIAPWTLARASMEASALAIWLLQFDIDADLRVRRSLALRYKGLKEQMKYSNSVGNKETSSSLQSRLDYLESASDEIGAPVFRDKKDKTTGIGIRLPNITNLIGSVLNLEVAYRGFSSMAHGHSWALIQEGFRSAQIGSIAAFEKHLKASSLRTLCQLLAYSFSFPTWQLCRLFGWSYTELHEVFVTIFVELGIANDCWHFWE
jgi:hypothetical protein